MRDWPNSLRLTRRRPGGLSPVAPAAAQRVTFTFNGTAAEALPGQTIAAALMSAGLRTLRTSPVAGEPRGVYCGIGLCFDCLVTVDGSPNARACLVPVKAGMCVQPNTAGPQSAVPLP